MRYNQLDYLSAVSIGAFKSLGERIVVFGIHTRRRVLDIEIKAIQDSCVSERPRFPLIQPGLIDRPESAPKEVSKVLAICDGIELVGRRVPS